VHPEATKGQLEVTTAGLPSSNGPSSPASLSVCSLEDSHTDEPPVTENQTKLGFLIRPFHGWTKRLRDDCARAGPSGLTTSSLRIEGAYGHKSPLDQFENVILIVGGTGIAGALPYLQQHVHPCNKHLPRAQDIHLIWAAKTSAMIRDVAAHELKPFLQRDDVHFNFHATRDKTPSDLELSRTVSDDKPSSRSEFQIEARRPNVRALVRGIADQINEAGTRGGRIALLTCGPAAMADDARAVVHQALKDGKRGLEYLEETFG
jgi:NAD(P)H-flavin reductase